MSIYAGLAAGIGEGIGQRNAKMMDYFTKKSETLTQLYQGLANSILQSGGDQDVVMEFLNRAKGWGSANPLFDPKGYQKLLKSEKTGIHDVIDQATQRRLQAQGMVQATPAPTARPAQAQRVTDPGFTRQGSQDFSEKFTQQGTQEPASAPVQNFAEMFTQQGTGLPSPTEARPIETQAPTQSQATGPLGGMFDEEIRIPSVQELIEKMTGGAPIYGAMGVPNAMGKMVMGTIPDILKSRMEMQHKVEMLESMFNTNKGGHDRRSPSGSAEFSQWSRMLGLNAPVTQWRHISRAMYIDPDTGEYKVGPVMESFRDESKWVSRGPGLPEREVEVIDSDIKVSKAADGSLWAETIKGPIRLGDNNIPIQLGTSNTSEPTIRGGQRTTSGKVFSQGSSADLRPPVDPVVTGEPTVGTFLPPGVNPDVQGGPPTSRRSTPGPADAYKPSGQRGSFSLEKLETSFDPTARQVAAYITQPENFDVSGPRREMWNYLFDKYTNGAITQAPAPIRTFSANFQRQREAIVNGFHATKNISNILNSSDGQLIGVIAGRWYTLMNKVGSSKGMFFGDKYVETLPGDVIDPTPESLKSIFPEIIKERPYLANKLTSQGDLLASKAADLITTMRIFNFADVRSTIGGVQGISSTYKHLKDALINPGMDMPLVLGHLNSLNRNMADGLLTLEQARWGPKIPYIREKELLSQLYWEPYVEDMVKKMQSNAASKGVNLSRQDAIFALWRNGKLEADPGNTVKVERVPETTP